MASHDPQRQKLEECIEIASKIAMCETDEWTKRATVMYCLERTVDGFPVCCVADQEHSEVYELTVSRSGQSHIEQS